MPEALASIPWTWLLIRASGVTSWALLTAVVVWGILLRTRLLGRLAGPQTLLHMHRWLGTLALTFLALHLAFLLVDPAVRFNPVQMLVPMMAPWKPVAIALGTVALWCMVPVSVVARLRPRLGKAGAAAFRRSHLLAYAAWPLATGHYVMAGTDALAEWSIGLIIAGTTCVVFALLARGFVPAPARPVRAAPARSQRPDSVPSPTSTG